MDLKQMLDRSILKPLRVDSTQALSLKQFLELAFAWKLDDRQILQGLRTFGLHLSDDRIGAVPLPASLFAGGATPVISTDGATALNAAILNKYLNAAGKTSVKLCYAEIVWSSDTTFAVNSAIDSAGIVSGDLAWSTNQLNVTVSGYTTIPATFANMSGNTFQPRSFGSSTTLCALQWFNSSMALQTTPDSDFVAALLVMGI